MACEKDRIWGDDDSLHRDCLGDISSKRAVRVSTWCITHGWQIQVNTSVGTIYGIFWFYNIKIYMYYVLKSICIIKETLVVFDIILARRRSENVSATHDVFKEKLIHRFITVLFRVVDFVFDLCIDNTVLSNCFRLPRCSLVGFLFIPYFIEHMFCSHSLFTFFSG